MPSAARGFSGAVAEPNTARGIQSLLTPTQISSLPASLTSAIPGSLLFGMRLLIRVYNHSAAGTLQIAGTAPLTGAAVSETTVLLPVAEDPGGVIEYVTTNTFASVNASGVTIGSGLTGGTVAIYGIYAAAANRMLPGEMKLMQKYGEHSPTEQRGVFSQDFDLLRLKSDATWEHTEDLYADRGLAWFLAGYNNGISPVSFPATPTSLLASTSVATSGSASLTTQPTYPGMIVQVTLGGTAPTTAGTVTITGTDEYGEAYSEVVVPSTKQQGTYSSEGRFASVNANGVAFTAFGAGATITITGVNGYQFAGLPDQTGPALTSYTIEQYDSEVSVVAPFSLMDEWTIEGGLDKEAKVTSKGPTQYIWPVGDLTNANNQITPFSQPLDVSITGWRSLAWVDDLAHAFGTSLQADVVDYKIDKKLNWVGKYTSNFNPPNFIYSRAYRKRYSIAVDITLDFTSATASAEFLKGFMRRNKRRVRLQVVGPLLAQNDGNGNPVYKGFTLDMPLKWTQDAERDFTSGQESVILKLKGTCYYDRALGYDHKLTWNTTFGSW